MGQRSVHPKQLTQATKKMYIIFRNQITTLDNVIQSNIKEKKNKNINIKEWTIHTGTDQTSVLEYIIVNTK